MGIDTRDRLVDAARDLFWRKGYGSTSVADVLQAAGVTRVHGICKDSSPVAKFVYRKFSSTSETFDFEPSPVSRLSAAAR